LLLDARYEYPYFWAEKEDFGVKMGKMGIWITEGEKLFIQCISGMRFFAYWRFDNQFATGFELSFSSDNHRVQTEEAMRKLCPKWLKLCSQYRASQLSDFFGDQFAYRQMLWSGSLCGGRERS
jgi:hypothetical protein